jgi:hypothetical protein
LEAFPQAQVFLLPFFLSFFSRVLEAFLDSPRGLRFSGHLKLNYFLQSSHYGKMWRAVSALFAVAVCDSVSGQGGSCARTLPVPLFDSMQPDLFPPVPRDENGGLIRVIS